MKRNLFTIIIASFFLLSVFSILSVVNNVKAEQAVGVESNLTDDMNSQGKPSIYGSFVVWNENIIDNGKSNWEIFLYDLSMDTDGDTIPNYLDSDTGSSDPAKIRITNNASAQMEPEIYGDKIVWEDDRFGNFDIFMYDLSVDSDDDDILNYLDPDDDNDLTLDINDTDSDPAMIRITDNPSHQEKPSIYGNKIVWVDKRYGNQDIFIYDLISESEAIIVGHKETGEPKYRPKQDYPKIYGNYVVWQDDRFINYEIYLYNLSTDSDSDGIPNYLDNDRPENDEAEKRILTSDEYEYKPVIYHNKIAYVKLDNIYVYDMEKEMEYKVTASDPSQKIGSRPCNIYGNKVVWTYDNGTKDVYMYDLEVDSDDDGTPNYMDSEIYSPDPALFQITSEYQQQIMLPAIYADKIVWQDSRNDSKPADRDIYIFTLTENKAPIINFPIPNYDPEILEGESFTFIIGAIDPEGESLTYSWYLDDNILPENDTFSLEFVSELGMSGAYEIKVIISDGETPVENIWILNIKESGIEPLEIIWVEPGINPTIIEGEEISLKLNARYLGSKETIITWEFQSWVPPPPKLIPQIGPTEKEDNEIYMEATFISQLEYNGSYDERTQDVTAKISDGVNTLTYTWTINVLFFEDADFDGYSDSLEIDWNSDPKLATYTPPDEDYDLEVDLTDNDIDGDGFLAKYDSDDTDFNKQAEGNPDNLPEILILLISVMLIVIALISLSRIQKP
jgi:beta propeller repeat protein